MKAQYFQILSVARTSISADRRRCHTCTHNSDEFCRLQRCLIMLHNDFTPIYEIFETFMQQIKRRHVPHYGTRSDVIIAMYDGNGVALPNYCATRWPPKMAEIRFHILHLCGIYFDKFFGKQLILIKAQFYKNVYNCAVTCKNIHCGCASREDSN